MALGDRGGEGEGLLCIGGQGGEGGQEHGCQIAENSDIFLKTSGGN